MVNIYLHSDWFLMVNVGITVPSSAMDLMGIFVGVIYGSVLKGPTISLVAYRSADRFGILGWVNAPVWFFVSQTVSHPYMNYKTVIHSQIPRDILWLMLKEGRRELSNLVLFTNIKLNIVMADSWPLLPTPRAEPTPPKGSPYEGLIQKPFVSLNCRPDNHTLP